MLLGNTGEYESIRGDLAKLRDCITQYTGFLMAGMGAAVFGLVLKVKDGESVLHLPWIAFPLSVLVSLLLVVLFYKFVSHNRYAGYCKLITQEVIDNGSHREDPDAMNSACMTPGVLPTSEHSMSYVGWETCVDKLRDIETASQGEEQQSRYQLGKCCHQILVANLTDEQREKAYLDATKVYSGMWSAVRDFSGALLGRKKPKSWGFPLSLTRVFLAFVLSLLALSVWILGGEAIHGKADLKTWTTTISIAIVCVGAQLWMWLFFARRLANLLWGHCTVEAFCWKFLPLRHEFMRLHGIRTAYLSLPMPGSTISPAGAQALGQTATAP